MIAKPAYRTVNFKEKEIRFSFNEYIVLKDLTKQLFVSPPLKNDLVITPQGTATKFLDIEILDTLKKNKLIHLILEMLFRIIMRIIK